MTQVRIVIRALNRAVEQAIARYVRNLIGILSGPADQGGTPRDTGWASVNWIPKAGVPFSGTAGTRAAAELGSLSSGPQEAGVVALSNYRVRQGRLYVTNNVPYIIKLNEGSSAKAPAGFVQNAILKAAKL